MSRIQIREIGRVRAAVLALLLAGHVLFSIFLVAPGHFVSDEGIYHEMAKAFADSGTLTLWSGYRDFPSPELRTWNHVTGKDGSLQSQYPYLYPVLAWPFYELAGFRGLFALNAIGYLALAGLCFSLCHRLWKDLRVAADSVILLTLCTYAWQYSQAAWPQVLGSAFILAALWFGVRAAMSEDRRHTLLSGLAAGMLLGLGAGIRLDVIFVLPALLVPLIYDRPPKLRIAGAMLLGLLPGLAMLSITNEIKFGTWQPLSYGRSAGGVSIGAYLPLFALGLAVLAIGWIATREPVWRHLVRHRAAASVAGISIGAASLILIPQVSEMLWRLLRGTWILTADLSLIDPSVGGVAVTRGPEGAILYADTVKKALLQSIPWLPLMLLAAARIPWNRRAFVSHAMPILSVMAFLAIYGWFTWHGGYAFNLRYFVPLLPILAIYGAKGIHLLWQDNDPALMRPAATIAAIVAGGAWLVLLFGSADPAAIEAVTLHLPLVLAVILTVLLLPLVIGQKSQLLRRLAIFCVSACLAWSFLMALMVDFPRSWFLREFRYETAQTLAAHVPPNSLLFSVYDPASFVLTEIPGARNVWVSMDDYRDTKAILERGLHAKKPLFAFFDDRDWQEFRKRGMPAGMKATEIVQGSYAKLYELQPTDATADGS